MKEMGIKNTSQEDREGFLEEATLESARRPGVVSLVTRLHCSAGPLAGVTSHSSLHVFVSECKRVDASVRGQDNFWWEATMTRGILVPIFH